jgi:hypothetical protein
MSHVRTRVSVTGFNEGEVRAGLPHLIDEFGHRPWLLKTDAFWDGERSRLVVTVQVEGNNARLQGGFGGASLDEISDCVIACFNFTSVGIHFDVETSEVVPASDQ